MKLLKIMMCILGVMSVTLTAYGVSNETKRVIVEPKSKIRVACVGDSITWGSGLQKRAEECYPTQLGEMLGAGYKVGNFGHHGATMLKNGLTSYWKGGFYKRALAFEPQIVIIKLGSNDSHPPTWKKHSKEFATDYKAMIASFLALESKPKIYLCYPAPWIKASPTQERFSALNQGIRPAIKKIAETEKLELIDLYTPLKGKPDFFTDGVHPNSKGAKVIAEKVYTAITNSASIFE